ncbi:MAG: hypothetical protein AB4352_23060 [Hormoscilla sp.]
MESLKLHSHVGADGILHVEMPPEVRNIDLEVMVLFQPLLTKEQQPEKKETLSEARVRLENVRQRYEGRWFPDSAELLREDRQR